MLPTSTFHGHRTRKTPEMGRRTACCREKCPQHPSCPGPAESPTVAATARPGLPAGPAAPAGGAGMRLRLPRRELSAYRVYLILEAGTSFLLGIAYATITVYWVTAGRLNALQLILLGTGLELSYFVFQLPTGLLADLASRRLCVLAGLFLMGLALVAEGASASFANLLAVQFVLGLGYALNNGAQEAWIADELAGGPLPPDAPIPARGPLADIGPAEPAAVEAAAVGAGRGDETAQEMTGVY